jgi:hypothetical protein
MAILYGIIWYFTTFYPGHSDESVLLEKLKHQADCWNARDIECFMADYWQSDSLMYIGKSGITYGWHQTLERYKLNYPDGDAMGNLRFEVISLKQIAPDYYFMVGKWNLERKIGNIGGHFSLLWKRIDGTWVIIADHSS